MPQNYCRSQRPTGRLNQYPPRHGTPHCRSSPTHQARAPQRLWGTAIRYQSSSSRCR